MADADAMNVAIDQGPGGGREATFLRPGVPMPDWSFVADPAAADALAASFAAAGRKDKWSGLDPAEDAVLQAILRAYPNRGRAPDARLLAMATGLAPDAVAACLTALRRRDLVTLAADGAVAAAYPFSDAETGHRVAFVPEGAANALCAIDALGAGAMLGRDSVIDSACPECGAAIRIATRDHGRDLASVAPAGTVVWSGIKYAGGCCANSGCRVKVFFCSDAHLRSWRARTDPDGTGLTLSPAAALQVGKAIFVPMLASAADPSTGTNHPLTQPSPTRGEG